MGTRAAFWHGDPRDFENRKWLGCIAFGGHPEIDGKCGGVMSAMTEEGFLAVVDKLSSERDFASPDGGWPFPWTDDVFLTDVTYAWFDGRVNVALFHHGFVSVEDAIDGKWPDGDDPTCRGVPAGRDYDRSQPDSIMIFGVPR